ncbi:MAG: hypothetical protein RMA76_05995 [Deltaproteobacteria bacterium]|jgi:hypothetical protein
MRRFLVAIQLVLVMMLNLAAAPWVAPDSGPSLSTAPNPSHPERDEAPSEPVDEREAEAEETADEAEEGTLTGQHDIRPPAALTLRESVRIRGADVHRTPPHRPPRSLHV